MTQGSNADQAAFWNAGPGQNWVGHQADLDAIHEDVTVLLLDACAARAGESVLDVGCGAGTSTFALARAVGPSGKAVGIDISVPLLRRAEARKAETGANNAYFELGDAQDHRFEGRAFDLVASRFGVMFFADPIAAFRNILGGLRRGGRIVFVAWAGPEANPWFTLPQRIAVARLGPVAPTPPGSPGPMAFRDIEHVCAIMTDAGFSACRGDYRETVLHHPGGVGVLANLASHVGPTARVLREKNGDDEDRAAIREALSLELRRFESADGVRIPAGINVFSAVRGRP